MVLNQLVHPLSQSLLAMSSSNNNNKRDRVISRDLQVVGSHLKELPFSQIAVQWILNWKVSNVLNTLAKIVRS